jgi:catalase
MSETEKKHIIDAFSFEVGSVMNKDIRQKVVDMLNNVDGDLATQIAVNIGAIPPKNPKKSNMTAKSPSLSMMNTVKSPATLKIAVLLERGYSYTEAISVTEALKASKVGFEIVSSRLSDVESSEGKKLAAGKTFLTVSSVLYDGVYVPGGRKSVEELMKIPAAEVFIKEAYKHYKTVAASSEGVDLISSCGINIMTADMKTEKEIKNDCGVVTVRNTRELKEFSAEFIKALSMHRHFSREKINSCIT